MQDPPSLKTMIDREPDVDSFNRSESPFPIIHQHADKDSYAILRDDFDRYTEGEDALNVGHNVNKCRHYPGGNDVYHHDSMIGSPCRITDLESESSENNCDVKPIFSNLSAEYIDPADDESCKGDFDPLFDDLHGDVNSQTLGNDSGCLSASQIDALVSACNAGSHSDEGFSDSKHLNPTPFKDLHKRRLTAGTHDHQVGSLKHKRREISLDPHGTSSMPAQHTPKTKKTASHQHRPSLNTHKSKLTRTPDNETEADNDDLDLDHIDEFNPAAKSLPSRCRVKITNTTCWRELTAPNRLYINLPASAMPDSIVVALHDSHGKARYDAARKQMFKEYRPISADEHAMSEVRRAEQKRRKAGVIDEILRQGRRLVEKSISDPVQVERYTKRNRQAVIYAVQHAKLRRSMMKTLKRSG